MKFPKPDEAPAQQTPDDQGPALQEWTGPSYAATATDPAAPEGLRQVAAESQANDNGLQPWYGPSYVGAAQDWYGGRNIEGTNNGWSTDFMARAFDYIGLIEDRSGATMNPTISWNMFDVAQQGNEKATGVATWDDPQGRWKRGDVFDNGVRVRNLYEDMDAPSADLMLADFLFTADEKQDIFSDSDRVNRLSREVTARSEEMTKTAAGAAGAYDFSLDVDERQRDIEASSITDPAIVATGTAGGAALGAGVGAFFAGVGAVPGAIIGGIIGGVGAYLNQDQVVEQVARASEITERALQKYDPIRASLTSASEWGGVVMKSISPFSNVWQGSYDALSEGGIGDGKSEFYEVNQWGERKAPAWLQVGDIAMTALDSVAQFASGPGRMTYMITMGGMGAGQLLGNVSTQSVFNMRTGDFDPLETPGEWAGAVLSPVIDVVQMGTARAVSRAATRFAREGQALGDAASATYTIERGGMKFVRDKATGEIVSFRKWTLGALAPSENIWQAPIRWKARTIALKSGRTEVTGDDLFKAASLITAPASPWRGALVNGLAEGYEEAWQGILDPMAVSEDIDGKAVFIQAMYGAAGGIGMSGGALMQRANYGESAYRSMSMRQVELEARLKHAWRTDHVMDDTEWAAFRNGLTDDQLRKMAASDAAEAREIGGVVRAISEQLTFDNTRASVLGDAVARAITTMRDSGLKKVNPAAEDGLVVLAFENSTYVTSRGMEEVARPNAAMMSSWQTMQVLGNRVRAMRVQLEQAQTAEDRAEIQGRLLQAEVLHAEITALQEQIRSSTRLSDVQRLVEDMNSVLRAAYDGKFMARTVDSNGNTVMTLLPPDEMANMQKAATLVLGRHPFLDTGSFAGFIPQVSYAMTLDNAHAAVGVHQAMLKPMQADHDGDRITTVNLAYLSNDVIENLRRGLEQIVPVAKPVLDANGDPVLGQDGRPETSGSLFTHNIDMPDGERSRMLVWTEELNKPTSTDEYKAVASAVDDMENWVIARFADKAPASVMTASGAVVRVPGSPNPDGRISWDAAVRIAAEFRRSFEAGDANSVQTLRDALLNEAGAGAISEMSVREPVLLELQQYFTTRFAKAGSELARLRTVTNTSTVTVDMQRPDDVMNQRAISRGTAGTVSATLGQYGHNDPTRDSQLLWYSTITHTLAMVRDNGWTNATIEQMARAFVAQGTGDSRTELEKRMDKNPVQGRVMAWLDAMVKEIEGKNPAFKGRSANELRTILAMMEVPAIERIEGPNWRGSANGESISLLQYLLRKSINVEEDNLRNVPAEDPAWAKLKTLRSLTYDNGPHSYTPKTALVEMMRWLPAETVVGPGDADYLGSNTTLNQLIKELTGLHPAMRKERIHRLKRSPAYMQEEHRGLGDPPYNIFRGAEQSILNENGDLRVNAYTLVVDALETAVNKLPDQFAARDKKASTDFKTGLRELWNTIDRFRAHLRSEGDTKEYTAEGLLNVLISRNSTLADMIVSLVPEASLSGTFSIVDNQVYAAPWLMKVLTADSEDVAEKDYFIYRHLAEFNFRGANVDMSKMPANLTGDAQEEWIRENTKAIDFNTLTSRFQQTLHIAASDQTGFLLGWLLQKADMAQSLEELLTAINDVPMLLRNRAPLLGYLDDVALFESRPEDLWSPGLESTKMLEKLAKWSSRVQVVSDAALGAYTMEATDKILLKDAENFLLGKGDVRNGSATVALVRQARRNRQRYPDSVGATARNEFLRVAWDPFVQMQDKGSAPEVATFLESILTSFTFGLGQGWDQAIDGVAAYSWTDVASNVTKLLDGPAQIMLPDGRTLLLDMSDDLTVVKMLQDPSTRAFAKAVLFNTVRDVDALNSIQHYMDTDSNGSIEDLLSEQSNMGLLAMDHPNMVTRLHAAHRGIGMIESALIKRAMIGLEGDQGAALLPITRSLGELFVAYTSRPDLDGVNKERLQDEAVSDMWAVLVALASKKKYDREIVRDAVLMELKARQGQTHFLEEMQEYVNANPLLQEAFEDLKVDMTIGLVEKSTAKREEARQFADLLKALPDPALRTQDEQDAAASYEKRIKQLEEQAAQMLEQANELDTGNLSIFDSSLFDAETAKSMYMMLDENETGISSAEVARRAEHNQMTRLNIRNLLQLGNNMEAFRGKGMPLDLMTKLSKITNSNLADLDDPRKFDAKDWKQLGYWAATIHFTQQTERSADQALRSLGTPEVDRVSDRTFAYLTDVMFNEAVLDEVAALMSEGLAAFPTVELDDISAMITGKLLAKDRLGEWNSSLVPETLKIAEMLKRGPIGLAVAAAGNNAKEKRSQWGTARATVTKPRDEHMSTLVLDPLNVDPTAWRRVSNGFFTELTITVNGQTRDVATMMGVPSKRDGMDSKYLILRKRAFDEAIDKLTAEGFIVPGQPVEVSITFVDPDKKPYTAQYINSVYFDKAGRNEEFFPAEDVISSSLSSSGGWVKDASQRVLDTAAKGGSAGFPSPSIAQAEINKLNHDPAQAGDFIRRAAQLILDKQYNDMSDMLDVDQAAVIKLLKQRFVVIGKINGIESVHWIDEVISMQGNLPFDTGTALIVELSPEVSSTLLSEQGMVIKPGVVAPTAVNPSTMATPGTLDPARLQRLGITGLGETIEWNDANSPLKSFSSLPPAMLSERRGDPYSRTYRERMAQWRAMASRVHQEYHEADRAGWDTRNEERRREIETVLGQYLPLTTFAQLGMLPDVVNSDAAASDFAARPMIQKFLGTEVSGYRIFKYTTKTGDRGVGLLSSTETDNNFQDAGPRPPVHGDAVIIDLDEFVTGQMTQSDWGNAARKVAEVMELFGHRGVRIFLKSTTTSYEIKERIATWMLTDPMGYEPVHNSTSMYVPVEEYGVESRTARMLRQSLTETEVWSPRDVAGRILSDDLFPLLGANENTVFIDTTYEGTTPATRLTQVLAPGDITIANERGAVSLNYPTPEQMPLLQRHLLPLLENDEAWAVMAAAHGATPEWLAEYSREQFAGDRDLLEPGILGLEAARQRLIDMLKRGKMPNVTDEVLPGEFLPIVNVARDGSQTVVLSRTGFNLPSEASMREQWSRQFSPDSPMKVAMSTNELNQAQTIPPPMVLTEEPKNYGNGLMMIGEFQHHTWGKWVDAFFSFKTGRVKLTALEFTGQMGRYNIWRPNELGSLTSESGKQTTNRMVNNFRDMFTVTGFDIRNLMVDAMIGKQADQDAYDEQWSKLETLLTKWSRRDHGLTEDQLYYLMTLDGGAGMSTAWQAMNFFASQEGLTSVVEPSIEQFLDDPTTRIATLAIMSLMAPRIHPQHIFSRPGMMSVRNIKSEDHQIVSLPPLFTKALQNPSTPKTTAYLFAMANSQMAKDADGPLYEFLSDFRLRTRMTEPDGTVTHIDGYLQLVKPVPATEDLYAYANANTIKDRRDESLHIAGVENSALGALATFERDFERKIDETFNNDAVIRFGATSARGTQGHLWQMLTRIKPEEDQPHRLMPLQWQYTVDGIEDLRAYCKAIDKADWGGEINRVREAQYLLLKELGLTRNLENQRIEIDYFVRQYYGAPGKRKGQENFVEAITAEDYIEAVNKMLWFAEQGRNPLEAAKVPFPHEAVWRKIFEAGKWRPALGRGDQTRLAADWEQAVYALFGQIERSREFADPIFRRPMDAFMRTYVDTLPSLASVPVSGDEQLNARLLDPDVNKHFISMDPGVSALLENPVITAEMSKTIANLMGLTKDIDPIELATVSTSSMMAHRQRVERWIKRQEMAPAVKTSYMEYMEAGTEYIGKAAHTHAFMSGMVNLALINRLLNPALFVSAVFEVVARTSLETFTDLVLGNQVRAGGILMNKAADRLEWLTRPLGASVDAEGKKAGINWRPSYDETEIELIRSLSRELAGSTDFMEYLYKELMFTNLVTRGRSKIGHALEKGASATARAFSDPRWGMPSQSVTQLYLVAALEHMIGNGAIVDVRSFVQQMRQDNLFLVKNSREDGGFSAHKAGVNRVAQVRALKPTVLGKMITAPINTMTHGNMGYNFMGHMLKIPFQFATFTANAVITLTGLGGVDQLIAMVADGRQKPGFINRMDAHIRGQKPLKETFDMSDVLEAVDLSRAFIRGGITQTGLFAAALLAGGLGLGGEDDEMRKRRKLAEYLNTPLYLDPREMQNDFLLADAIFLDSIPILGTIFEDEDMPPGERRSVVVPHWIIRQFTSPMMGTMRFMQTGNVSDIREGFADAFSVLPYSISYLWEEATMTADLIFQQAKNEDYEGNSVTAQSSVTELLINGFSIYEKALLENSFINGVRNGADQFNRNPWVVPATDETGNILMREGTNNMPLPSQALAGYTDPVTGQALQGYDKRSGLSGVSHAYAENNLTFSLLASLVTGQVGGDSTFLRNNMVVGETTIDLPRIEDARAEALFFSTYVNQGGQALMSFDEAVRKVKSKYEAAGKRWEQGKVEEEAQLMLDNFTKDGLFGGMSVLDKDGREIITKEGAKSVFHSIGKGMLNGDEGSIPGIWVDFETRVAIEQEWAEDLIQEGVDLGLSQQSAEYRMRRIMRGDDSNPDAPGLRDILYSDKIIPYSGKARYNQLNMTYMIGPDGKPWATPFGRQNVAQALGIPLPSTPVPAGPGMRKDARGKLIDDVYGINLGVTGLQRQLEEPPEMPDESALDAAAAKTYTPQQSNNYTPFRRFGRGGGGGYSSFGPGFSFMQRLPENRVAPRPDDISFINTNTPFVRRARVNTERVSSDRGRLKQWQ